MTYFLPSFIQKRLLRYALSRLDFIETDALNLEDLDITIGQRSVVELKNVGIKVDKLVEQVQIPSTVVLTRASIRFLRVTIPADLHVSGIAVEVDGVDVQLELKENERIARKSTAVGPSHGDVANRPRIAPPSPHDPGGHEHGRRAGYGEYAHVIPTSQDLAMSFLESEPRKERLELEAVVQSQSYRLQESVDSLEGSADESGVGMPGGFSLPGFVATFFAGVADRLSANVTNITARVTMKVNPESSTAETMRVMVHVSSVSLDSLRQDEESLPANPKRSINVNGFNVFLLSEADSFSRSSATSSPKLTKSRSKMSNSDDDSMRHSNPSRSQFPDLVSTASFRSTAPDSPIHTGLSSDGSSSSSQLADLSVDLGDPLLSDSQAFRPSLRDSVSARSHEPFPKDRREPHVDNRRHAESLIGSESLSRNTSDVTQTEAAGVEDLTESRMFTHDQAESMYMSAVSAATDTQAMPGAWDSFTQSTVEQPRKVSDRSSGLAQSDAARSRRPFPEPVTAEVPRIPDAATPNAKAASASVPEMDLSDLVAKQLLHIDQLTVKVPASASKETAGTSAHSKPDSHVGSNRGANSQFGRDSTLPTARMQESKFDTSGSRLMQSTHLQNLSRDFAVSSDFDFILSVGIVSVNLDMAIGRMLVAGGSQLNRCMPSTSGKPTPADSSKTAFSLKSTLKQIVVNVCQTVPEISASRLPTSLEGNKCQDVSGTSLLQFSLSNIRHDIALNIETRQKLAIEKIVLDHSSQKYLYFLDSLNVRDSVANSQILKPDDLIVTNLDDRYEVQMKPMHAVIDLLKVDDVLSRSGGLSSVLDLGNSIMSTGTVTEMSPKPKTSPARQRAVRFDSPGPRSRSESDASTPGLKIDIRISGAVVDLIGSESSVQIKSSAIKLVSRAGNFRAQIDTIMLAGPVLGRSQTKPGVNVKIANVSVYFRDSPEEQDLDRLLSLLTPSGDKYDDEDDIMVDTLIRQRRKGSVLRLSTGEVKVDIAGAVWLKHVTKLGDELSKLATVTKYLPEDDRPGMLTFGLINRVNINVDFGKPFGLLHLTANLIEGSLITVPSLMAAQVSSLSLKRGEQMLLGDVIPNSQDQTLMGPPVLMCRFIADEMEPTVRIKLTGACLEYTVPAVVAFTELAESFKPETSQPDGEPPSLSSEGSNVSEKSDLARKIQISFAVRNSAIALNLERSTARGLFLLSDAGLTHGSKHNTTNIQLDLKKASVLIVDDVARIGHDSANADHKLYFEENDQVQELTKAGYVPVGSISNASAIVQIIEEKETNSPVVDIEFRNNLFYMETCADSTQTLIQILSHLAPPSAPSPVAQYRTEIVPIEDMLASFTGNAFVSEAGPELGLQASHVSIKSTSTDDYGEDTEPEDYEGEEGDSDDAIHELSQEDEEYDHDRMTESYLESEMGQSRMMGSPHVAPVNLTASSDLPLEQSIMAHSMLDFRTDHFVHKSSVGGTAHRWNSSQNTYGLGSETSVQSSPLKFRIRDMHIIWNLFDGYDWQNTRDTISQAVKDIETKAMARQPKRDSRLSPAAEEDESVIGDFLFNSIYIGIPANKDPRDLANAINNDLGDGASETGSYATGTTITATPSGRAVSARNKPKKLRLSRSKQHKMTFELKGVSADFITFPPESGEVESSVDVRVRALEVFDHVPTSTWKKFATYMHEAGEREVDTNMVHIELLIVKPIAELAASELVLKITVLPLRLHVDQDALDFLTRFFEFKDERAPVSATPSAPPFLQRVEVNPIRLRLDFKPKRVDYGGLRSGRTTEFMNFFVLDRSDMVLRRVILYGVSGLDRLGIMLNNIWSPDVRKNQLPGVLAGLAPIRSLVDVGSGVKDLIAVPIREYKKDGRIVRSIQKGAIAFAKTTTTELVNLGAKLAIGTQTVLQNAEGVLVPKEQGEDDDEEKEQISLYADQPIGIVQGLRGAYASLERDLLLAKDAIVAIPGEVMASGSAAGAAKAIMRQSPTIILRPAIGATKAVGQTLLGAGNTLDRGNLRRVEEKYKRH